MIQRIMHSAKTLLYDLPIFGHIDLTDDRNEVQYVRTAISHLHRTTERRFITKTYSFGTRVWRVEDGL